MTYYFNTSVDLPFEEAVNKVSEELAKEGFGILTRIDMTTTLKNKIEVDFKPYMILGACLPRFAHKALMAEDKVGLLLPCNVVVIGQPDGQVEIAAIDPVANMMSVDNPILSEVADEVRQKLKRVVSGLKA